MTSFIFLNSEESDVSITAFTQTLRETQKKVCFPAKIYFLKYIEYIFSLKISSVSVECEHRISAL